MNILITTALIIFSVLFCLALCVIVSKIWEQCALIGQRLADKSKKCATEEQLKEVESWAKLYCHTMNVDYDEIEKLMRRYDVPMLNKPLIKNLVEYQQKREKYPHKRYSIKRIIGKTK